MFVKHGCPGGNKVKFWQNILVPHFDPPNPKGEGGCDVSDVHVSLLYQHPFFKYCTLCKWDGITYRHTDGQIEKLTSQLLDANGGSFRSIGVDTCTKN